MSNIPSRVLVAIASHFPNRQVLGSLWPDCAPCSCLTGQTFPPRLAGFAVPQRQKPTLPAISPARDTEWTQTHPHLLQLNYFIVHVFLLFVVRSARDVAWKRFEKNKNPKEGPTLILISFFSRNTILVTLKTRLQRRPVYSLAIFSSSQEAHLWLPLPAPSASVWSLGLLFNRLWFLIIYDFLVPKSHSQEIGQTDGGKAHPRSGATMALRKLPFLEGGYFRSQKQRSGCRMQRSCCLCCQPEWHLVGHCRIQEAGLGGPWA